MMNTEFRFVTEENIEDAARIHADAWRQSHKDICSDEFVRAHTTERQKAYIREQIGQGRAFYLLREGEPKGIVSVYGNLIENLYVAPQEQRKGYGTRLLQFAESICVGNPVLWILSSNRSAEMFYKARGYHFTGNRKELKNSLYEREMTHIIS